ncbi:MAG: nucleotide sugar dehydrogenase [Sandaracinaceae bacterium]|nr:nucleotide sugar dehydrogenase [Sandaracinaceae bacterium]
MVENEERVAIVGLGYVGLPVALAFARTHADVVGLDVSEARIEELRAGVDRTDEVDAVALRASRLRLTSDPAEVGEPTMIVITVPTPIDGNRQPDLRPIEAATRTVAGLLRPGTVVVYESTVYPGVTEEICGPLLERESGLVHGRDFNLGYSPERINPGDREHTLERTVKVVAGDSPETLARVARAYERFVDAGVHRAPSIRVAEAAKVIENTQRDLNIALMNELAIIFDRLGIRTKDVLAAAGTKWNFLPFTPGLVGGHCIGVDPYYLTAKAEAAGYHPQVILSGRRINDGMGSFVAQRLIKLMITRDVTVQRAKVGVLGLTFKENVPDLRNSRVPDILAELRQFGIEPIVHDPRADAAEAMHEYGLRLASLDEMQGLDGLVLAVAHREYAELPRDRLFGMLGPRGAIADIKAMLTPEEIPPSVAYWSL